MGFEIENNQIKDIHYNYDGTMTFSFTPTKEGNNTIQVKSKNKSANIIVEGYYEWNISIINNNNYDSNGVYQAKGGTKTNIMVKVTDNTGNIIQNGNILVRINDETEQYAELSTSQYGFVTFATSNMNISKVTFYTEDTQPCPEKTVLINWTKDTPTLSWDKSEITNTYDDTNQLALQNTLNKLTIRKSNGEPIYNAAIEIYINKITLSTTRSETGSIYLGLYRTDMNGECTPSIPPFAGLQVVTAKFGGSQYYNSVIVKYNLIYNITRKYTLPVKNGEALLDFEQLSNENMLGALGVYDVEMKYKGTSKNEGCIRYNESTNIQSIRCLKPTKFINITTKTEEEAGTDVTIAVRLVDELNNPLPNQKVICMRNNSNTTTLTTDENGEVSLVNSTNIAGCTDEFLFIFHATIIYAGTNIAIPLTRKKITPLITIPEITCYVGIETTISSKLYRNLNNVTKTLSGLNVSFIDENNKIIGNGVTNSNGVVSCKYIHNVVETCTIKILCAGNNTYNSTNKTIKVTINPKVKINLPDKTFSTIYGMPCTLPITLKDEKGNILKQHPVQFKLSGNLLSSQKTDNNGQASYTYIPRTGKSNIIQIYCPSIGIYESCTSYYTVNIEKQNPILNVTFSKNEIYFGDNIIATVSLKENENIPQKQNMAGLPIVFYKNYGSQSGGSLTYPTTTREKVATILTDNNGKCNYTYSNLKPGNPLLSVMFGGNDYYNSIEKTTNIKVKQTSTTIVETKITTDTDKQAYGEFKLYYILNGNKIPLPNMQIKFKKGSTFLKDPNNTPYTVTSNNVGIFKFEYQFDASGKYDITAVFEGNSNYLGCTHTFSIELKEEIIDPCEDLNNFITAPEKYYGSDENTSNIGGIALKTVCKNYHDKGYSDNEGIHATSGIILVSKNLKITQNCTVTFKVKFKESTLKPSIGMYGGHFGLVMWKDNTKTAEFADVRYELYQVGTVQNGYIIQYDHRPNQKGEQWVPAQAFNLFKPNTWYDMAFKLTPIDGEWCKLTTIVKEFGLEKETTVPVRVGCSPYFMSFVDNSEVIMREIKITEN